MRHLPLIPLCLLTLFSCATSPPSTLIIREHPGTIETIMVDAPSLQGNLWGDPTQVECRVYLPHSYFDHPQRKFQVLYHLGGPGEIPRQISCWQVDFDELMDVDGNPGFIVVEPNATTPYHNTLFANSPVTGNWEDFVVKDLPSWIDAHFRTNPKREGRALSGFYFGGASAVLIGMSHPDRFARVLAFDPALMPDGTLKADMERNWYNPLTWAYGSTFSPNLKLPKPWAEVPTFDGTPEDNAVIERWEGGFGHLKDKVQAYARKEIKLDRLEIQVGSSIGIPWVFRGCQALDGWMTQARLDYRLVIDPVPSNQHHLEMSADSGRMVVLPFMAGADVID